MPVVVVLMLFCFRSPPFSVPEMAIHPRAGVDSEEDTLTDDSNAEESNQDGGILYNNGYQGPLTEPASAGADEGSAEAGFDDNLKPGVNAVTGLLRSRINFLTSSSLLLLSLSRFLFQT